MTVPEPDERDAYMYRLAQSNRLRRHCEACGVDPQAVVDGTATIDWSAILDEHGRITPERIDIERARRRQNGGDTILLIP
jgi:hypothetical protein